jgi:lipid-binding SYLF domain-containing protein
MNEVARLAVVVAVFWSAVLALPGHGAGWDPQAQTQTLDEAEAAIAKFKATDPQLERFFKQAHGYAIYPTVGKGGFVFGGAFGRGVVYEQGKPIGRSKLTQVTFGLQIGGQSYSELLFFKDKAALDKFKQRNSELAASASAVIMRDGAAATASYDDNGVAVFVAIKGGGMLEASLGGQQFEYDDGLSD